MKTKFGTDGIRGTVGVDINSLLAYRMGLSLGKLSDKSIAIGIDTRYSSPNLLEALISGITSMGKDVTYFGVVPTPFINWVMSTDKYSYGVIITASHNPSSDNGIKIVGKGGTKIDENIKGEIERHIKEDYEPTLKDIGRVRVDLTQINNYITHLKDIVGPIKVQTRVLLDLANGSTYKIAKRVFRNDCLKLITINDEPNGKNINLNCGSTCLSKNIKEYSKYDYEMGFSYDGDGDRTIAFLNDGTIINGDMIVYLLQYFLKREGLVTSTNVVMTIMSEKKIIEDMLKRDILVSLSDVGDYNVLQKMNETNSDIGGEPSGHVIIKPFFRWGDGLFVSLLLLKFYSLYKTEFIDLINSIKREQVLDYSVAIEGLTKLDDKRLQELIDQYKDKLLNIVVRKSGTENVMRVHLEGSGIQCQKFKENFNKLIKKENDTCVES